VSAKSQSRSFYRGGNHAKDDPAHYGFCVCIEPYLRTRSSPKDGVYISDADVKAVLKRAVDMKRTNPDNAIRVIDMGNYQLSVSVIHRGAMGGGAAAGATRAEATPRIRAPGNSSEYRAVCHVKGLPVASGILHDNTAERPYIVTPSR